MFPAQSKEQYVAYMSERKNREVHGWTEVLACLYHFRRDWTEEDGDVTPYSLALTLVERNPDLCLRHWASVDRDETALALLLPVLRSLPNMVEVGVGDQMSLLAARRRVRIERPKDFSGAWYYTLSTDEIDVLGPPERSRNGTESGNGEEDQVEWLRRVNVLRRMTRLPEAIGMIEIPDHDAVLGRGGWRQAEVVVGDNDGDDSDDGDDSEDERRKAEDEEAERVQQASQAACLQRLKAKWKREREERERKEQLASGGASD